MKVNFTERSNIVLFILVFMASAKTRKIKMRTMGKIIRKMKTI